MDPIYCGVRAPTLDAKINADFEAGASAAYLAEKYGRSVSAVYRAKNRVRSLKVFELELRGNGTALPLGAFAARSFLSAAKGALRHFDALAGLELAEWTISDGVDSVGLVGLKSPIKRAG